MYKIGDVIEGTVTGIQQYGVFVSLDEEHQGLIHISECTHGYIPNVHHFLKVGEKIKVMIIDIDEYTKKISLSIRALEKLTVPRQLLKKKKRRKSHHHMLGFETIRKKLPQWIADAQVLIESEQQKQDKQSER